MQKPKIIVILGPTASGKSDLAVKIARKYNGEIISADSRQVYKGLDIGSGKITKKEMKGVPHHLLDVANPKRRYSVANFKKDAEKSIQDILNRGKLPILCGGTGFYIQAIVDNIVLPEIKPDWKLRKELEKKSNKKLFEMLQKLDPERAKNIDAKNPRRLIRAIEIAKANQKEKDKRQKINSKTETENTHLEAKTTVSSPDKGRLGWVDFLQIGIKPPDEILKKKIKIRLAKRFKKGMIEEVEKLRKGGLSWKRLEEFGLEYRYIALFLQKKLTREEMEKQLYDKIWQFAKRQMTWFKRDKRIKWINNAKEFNPQLLR